MVSLICTRIKGWVNNGKAGDLRRNRAHYDVIVIIAYMSLQRGSHSKKIFTTSVHNGLKRVEKQSYVYMNIELHGCHSGEFPHLPIRVNTRASQPIFSETPLTKRPAKTEKRRRVNVFPDKNTFMISYVYFNIVLLWWVVSQFVHQNKCTGIMAHSPHDALDNPDNQNPKSSQD